MRTLAQAGRLLLALLLCLVVVHTGRARETDARARDPSTIVRDAAGVYWLFGTGPGIPAFSSLDRVHWAPRGRVFARAPAWVAASVPQNTRNFAWAPDVHFFAGQWHLYYCYSSFGTNRSGIGVATSGTLTPTGWKDQGLVVQTGPGTDSNAIDPCIFEDAAGGTWLSYGSFFSGIKLIRVDPATGKQSAQDHTAYTIASRPDTPGNPIEASAIVYHKGYYYLFVNWDACCRGARSTYNIRMGRARAVTGPYLDRAGRDMQKGGGSVFLASVYDNGTGQLCDDQVGPGHAGILRDSDGTEWVSFHEEWARDQNGATIVNIRPLAWDHDGWPCAILDPGPWTLVTNLATHDLATADAAPSTPGSTLLHAQPHGSLGTQQWLLQYQDDGCYTLLDPVTRKALTAPSPAVPGSPVTLAAPHGQPGQRWRFRLNDNGTVTLLPQSGGQAVALDVRDCNAADGAPIGLATVNNLPCQEWTFHAH